MGKHRKPPRGPKGPDERDYDVGYSKPPEGTRFKKGQSGNPSGRPPKKASLASILSEVAYHPVRVERADGVSSIPLIQAALLGGLQQSAKGKGSGIAKVVLEQMERHGVGMDASDQDLRSIDQELFDRLMSERK